ARDLPDDNLKTVRFGGSPLVVGDNVYIAARASKGNGYEDYYVLCFDLGSGAYRWSCYVSGAPSLGQMMGNGNNQYTSFEIPTHLSYSSGRVFVTTDLGAVAALDAFSGNVAWLDLYRDATDVAAPDPAMFGPNRWGRGFGFGGGFQGNFTNA